MYIIWNLFKITVLTSQQVYWHKVDTHVVGRYPLSTCIHLHKKIGFSRIVMIFILNNSLLPVDFNDIISFKFRTINNVVIVTFIYLSSHNIILYFLITIFLCYCVYIAYVCILFDNKNVIHSTANLTVDSLCLTYSHKYRQAVRGFKK